MKIQNVNGASHHCQSFGALKPDLTMSNKIFKEVSKTPVVKTFAKNYDANIGIVSVKSSQLGNNNDYLALSVYDVKPANLLTRLLDIVKKPVDHIVLKTHAVDEDAFVQSIARKSKNGLVDIYKDSSK